MNQTAPPDGELARALAASAQSVRNNRETRAALARADAKAELSRLFPDTLWFHEASGGVRVSVRDAHVTWTPDGERRLGGFPATFGRFRFEGAVNLTAEQLEALLAYASAVEAGS